MYTSGISFVTIRHRINGMHRLIVRLTPHIRPHRPNKHSRDFGHDQSVRTMVWLREGKLQQGEMSPDER